jgi:hypothetical protein
VGNQLTRPFTIGSKKTINLKKKSIISSRELFLELNLKNIIIVIEILFFFHN